MSELLRNPQTGEVHAIESKEDLAGALAAGYTPVQDSGQVEQARLRERGYELNRELGTAAEFQAAGQAAGRSLYDMGAAAPRLLGGEVAQAADVMEGLGLGSAEDARALATTNQTAAAIGGVAPDVALMLASGGLGSALKGGGKLAQLGINLAADTITGGLAGAQVADEEAWRAGQELSAEDRRSAALTGAALGGGLGLAGTGLAKGISKVGEVGEELLAKGVGKAKGSGAVDKLSDAFIDNLPPGARQAARKAKSLADDATGGTGNQADVFGRQRGTAMKEADAFGKKNLKSLDDIDKARGKIAKTEADFGGSKKQVQEKLRIDNKKVSAQADVKLKRLEKKLADADVKGQGFAGQLETGRKKLSKLEAGDGMSSRMKKELAKKEEALAAYDAKIDQAREAGRGGQVDGMTKGREKYRNKVLEDIQGIRNEAKSIRQKAIDSQKKEISKLERKGVNATKQEQEKLSAQIQDLKKQVNITKKDNAAKAGEKIRVAKEKSFSAKRSLEDEIVTKGEDAASFMRQRDLKLKEAGDADTALKATVAAQGDAAEAAVRDSLPMKAFRTATQGAEAYVQPGLRPQAHFLALAKMKPYGDWNPQTSFNSALGAVLDGEQYEPAELQPIAMGGYSSSFAEPKTAYIANMEAIRKIAQDPTLMMDLVGQAVAPELQQINPELYAMKANSAMKAVEVMSRFGKPFKPDTLTGKPRYSVSTSESLAYKDAWETAFSPQKFVNDFASGRLNREKWGIAQEVYPELTQDFQFRTMQQLQEVQPSLSQTQRRQLSIVTGSRDIMSSGLYQQTYQEAAMAAMPKSPPRQQSMAGQSEAMKEAGTLSQQAMVGS